MNVLLFRPRPHKETIGLQNVMICEPLELEYIAANTGIGQTAMAGANPFFQRVSVNFEETEEISFEAICDEE